MQLRGRSAPRGHSGICRRRAAPGRAQHARARRRGRPGRRARASAAPGRAPPRARAAARDPRPGTGSPRASSAAMIGTACACAATSTATEACGIRAAQRGDARRRAPRASAARPPGKSRSVDRLDPGGRRLRGARRQARRVGDRARAQVIGGAGRSAANSALLKPTSSGTVRKLRRRRSAVSRTLADAALRASQEQAHLRVPEAVDGLHRVADHEQRAPVALLPAGGERGAAARTARARCPGTHRPGCAAARGRCAARARSARPPRRAPGAPRRSRRCSRPAGRARTAPAVPRRRAPAGAPAIRAPPHPPRRSTCGRQRAAAPAAPRAAPARSCRAPISSRSCSRSAGVGEALRPSRCAPEQAPPVLLGEARAARAASRRAALRARPLSSPTPGSALRRAPQRRGQQRAAAPPGARATSAAEARVHARAQNLRGFPGDEAQPVAALAAAAAAMSRSRFIQ